MAVQNCIHVVLINPGGNLIHRMQAWGDASGGSAGVEASCRSGLQAVAVFVEKDLNGENGGPFWDEYSGRSMLAVQETFEGLCVCQHDTQPSATDIRDSLNDGTVRSKRTVDSKLANVTMGKGANWDCYEDGQGSEYETKLAEARTLVGFPTT